MMIMERLWPTSVANVVRSPRTLQKRSFTAGLLKTNSAGLGPLRVRQQVSPICRPLLFDSADESRFSPTQFSFMLPSGRNCLMIVPRRRLRKNATVLLMATLSML